MEASSGRGPVRKGGSPPVIVLPYSVVGPYWKDQLVSWQRGSTHPRTSKPGIDTGPEFRVLWKMGCVYTTGGAGAGRSPEPPRIRASCSSGFGGVVSAEYTVP